VARPRVNGERKRCAACKQASDALALDDVVDHRDEKASGSRSPADEDGGAVPDRELAVSTSSMSRPSVATNSRTAALPWPTTTTIRLSPALRKVATGRSRSEAPAT
jgi:hypothetical protein